MIPGDLDIMKLVSYTDSTFNESIDEYTALASPESYSVTYNVNINEKGAQGSSVPVDSFNSGSPQTISFKILFDGTGIINNNNGGNLPALAIPGAGGSDVTQEIEKFKRVVYNYQSATHQPSYVQIRWGTLLYNCRLVSLTINFKLFKPDGSPLRAEADCRFRGSIDEKKLAAIEGRLSPDITHIRTVAEGDTLPLLCFREYGDSKYYYQVAKVNGLIDIKQLTPGMKILFPPIITN